MVAVVCIAAAAAVLLVAAANYRHSVSTTAQPETVLVASSLIQKGTSGSVISSQAMVRPERIAGSEVSAGAIPNAAAIQGKVAAIAIQPGQQLTLTDFTVGGGGIASQLAPDERAISLPLDSSHGLGGVLQAGDRVDVYVGEGSTAGAPGAGSSAGASMKLLLSNIPVLSIGAGGSGGIGSSGTSGVSNVLLSVKADAAAALAFASDNDKVWLVLRGANATGPDVQDDTATATSLPVGSNSTANGGAS